MPDSSTSPPLASITCGLHKPFKRAANEPVKDSGICWTMRIGTQSEGIPSRKVLTASVPPVEAPTKTIFPFAGNGRVGESFFAALASMRTSPGRQLINRFPL